MPLLQFVMPQMLEAFKSKTHQTEHGLEVITKSKNGYGKIHWTIDGIQMGAQAYRIAWLIERGPIPEGHDVDHDPACPKSCVTVDHLQVLPHADHTSLSWKRGEIVGREELADRTCNRCGETFRANISVPNIKSYCSAQCKIDAKNERRKKVRYPRLDSKVCAWIPCGIDFAPKRRDTMFCSRKCVDDAQNHKKKLRKEAANVMP